MATAPCDCPKTTMWRTRSSTAQLSSPRLDTPLTTGTPPLHPPFFFYLFTLQGELWASPFDVQILLPSKCRPYHQVTKKNLWNRVKPQTLPSLLSFPVSLAPLWTYFALAAALSAGCIIQKQLLCVCVGVGVWTMQVKGTETKPIHAVP